MGDDSIKHDDDSVIHETGDLKAHPGDHTPNALEKKRRDFYSRADGKQKTDAELRGMRGD